MDDRRIEYSRKLKSGEPISYNFITYTHSVRELTLSLVSQFLGEKHLIYLRSAVFTFLTEIINNAVKANLKRVYIDSENEQEPDDFNEKAVANIDSFTAELKDEKLLVQISMQQQDEGLLISVTNNTGMTPGELKRVQDRLDSALQFNSIEEVMEHFIDTSEGGGLGLILTITLLKNSSISPDRFKLESNGKMTRASLMVPARIISSAHLESLKEKILKSIEFIPAFPETTRKVLDICNKPESSMSQVAQEIEKDPALTADILKMVNSATFTAATRVKSLSAALPRLGIKNIKQVTLASASLNTLKENFSINPEFWEHSFKCGFYSRKIAEILHLRVEKETVYLGGLLHDLGKIILRSIDPTGFDEIEHIKIDKNRMTNSILEEVNLGISHEQIGALVAENWGFSNELVDMIQNHHRPFMSDRKSRLETSVVHVSNALINTEDNTSSYIYIDPDAFKRLSLGSMEELKILHNDIKKAYQENKNLLSTQ